MTAICRVQNHHSQLLKMSPRRNMCFEIDSSVDAQLFGNVEYRKRCKNHAHRRAKFIYMIQFHSACGRSAQTHTHKRSVRLGSTRLDSTRLDSTRHHFNEIQSFKWICTMPDRQRYTATWKIQIEIEKKRKKNTK